MTKTTVLLMRHEFDNRSGLTGQGILRARSSGATLAAQGISIGRAHSSPRWRCVQTVQEILAGADSPIGLEATEPSLDDIRHDTLVRSDVIDQILDEARVGNTTKEQLFLSDRRLREDILRRGSESAALVRRLVREHPGETLLVCSHGGSRLEPTICNLIGVELKDTPAFVERGGVVRLDFEESDAPEFKYLGVPAEADTPFEEHHSLVKISEADKNEAQE